jgi:DNA-binding NarL/FixJ family response regulator
MTIRSNGDPATASLASAAATATKIGGEPGRSAAGGRPRAVQVATGLSNAEIAAKLALAEPTVKTHVGRVLSKLQLRDRVQAVV